MADAADYSTETVEAADLGAAGDTTELDETPQAETDVMDIVCDLIEQFHGLKYGILDKPGTAAAFYTFLTTGK